VSTKTVVSYCGVSCNHCGMQTRISKMAGELKRFIGAYGYGEWISNITQDFDFNNMMKGLDWFAGSTCPNCLNGGGMPRCEIRTCCLQKKLTNCYFCQKFSGCAKLNYQKETYQIEKHYEKVRQTGYENWLNEQKEKTKENFDNIEYLEKKRGK
jgi:hypothetical protein